MVVLWLKAYQYGNRTVAMKYEVVWFCVCVSASSMGDWGQVLWNFVPSDSVSE